MKKRMIAVLVLALALLLAVPTALAAEPDGTARFYLNGTQYRVEPDGESGQIVRAWEGEDWGAEPATLPTGVTYDLTTNTLTLSGASLETAEFRYVMPGDEGMDYWLPNANLTIELVGENSIALSPDEINPNQFYHALIFGGGIHATVTGSGSLAVSTVASHDGFAILACEESTLTFADQVQVTAEVTGTYVAEEGPVEVPALVSDGAAVTVKDQASFTAKDPVSFGGKGANRAAFTVEDQAIAAIQASGTGLQLYQTDLTVSGGRLSVQMTGNGTTGTNPAGEEYDDWTQGVYCDSSVITLSGGTLDISFPNGTGIGFGGEGGSTLVQTGGTLDVTATERVDSICLELFQMSGGHTTLTFRGGETNLTGLQGLYVGSGNVVRLENGANVTIDSDFESYYGGCNVDGTLNVHGGTFIVDANNTYALQLNEDSAYNQSGGDVTLTARGGDSCGFLALGNDCRITISGGSLTATSGYTGAAFLGDFTLLGGTVVINGVSAGATVNGCDMQLQGGSLQVKATGENSQAVLLIPNEGTSLTVTGGNHSFLAPVTGEESRYPQGLRSISVPVSFQGGSVRMTGKIPMIWYGEMLESGGTTDDGANQITLSGGMHIVSNNTGNELSMLQFTTEGTTEPDEDDNTYDYTVYEYYCTEDNTVGGRVCTDLTISAEAGEIPVGYTGSMEVISGQATVGAPVVIQYTVVTKGTVSIALPENLDYIPNSLSVNGQAQENIHAIQVDGSAVILFSVKPMVENQTLTITAGVTTAEGSYQETCTVKASGFDITAPTYTKVTEIRVSGRGTPGDVVTLKIGGETVQEITVTELGTFAATVELPVRDAKAAEEFTIEVSVDDREVKDLKVQYDPNTSTVTYLSITNVVHNNKNERVSLTVDVDYLADAAQQSYYTYWPDENAFTFNVKFDGTVENAKVLVTLQDGTVEEVKLDPTTDPKVWTGELELTDPSNPPVRYQVGWKTGAYEALSSAHTFMPIMDPSGVVYSGSLDTPVAGATVTLLYGGNGINPGTASVFDMEPFDQVNPQITDALGNYGWNVPEGWWKIRATYVQNGKTYTVESQWLHVQPVQTGVNLDLNLPVKPTLPTLPGGILLPGLVGGDDGFRDVAESAYYYNAVEWAVDKGVTEGTGSGKFSPDRACTRGEIVTFLYRAAGCPAPVSEENPFTDVHQGDYYYDAVLWAVEQGITQGTSKTTFSPGTTCTRAQAVTFLYRYFASPTTSAALSFTDVPASAYYCNAVRWAVSGGITQGTGKNTFRPDKTCTRAEIVTFLYRAMA